MSRWSRQDLKQLAVCLSIIAIVTFALGFTWPWEAQQEDPQQTSLPKEEPGRFVWPWDQKKDDKAAPGGDEIQWETRITSEADVGVATAVPIVDTNLARAMVKPQEVVKTYGAVPVKDVQTMRTGVKTTPTVSDVERQLTELIQLNESIRQSQQGQVKSAQRIIEQARIHQRILKDIKTTQSPARNVQPTNADEILKQEKLRLIREQTERNRRIIESLNQKR